MSSLSRFQDRRVAGRQLAAALSRYRHQPDTLVLALPRGGVPVAYEVARLLELPLDLLVVRKLGVPGYPELAMGAIASGGVQLLNDDVVSHYGIRDTDIEAVAAREQCELERREHAYRGDHPWPTLAGRQVILVDDGLATGATMRAALRAARAQGARKIVVAVPVAAAQTVSLLRREVDDVETLTVPADLLSIGSWYRDFDQVPDEEVTRLLTRAWSA